MSKELLLYCQPFVCGDADLDGFFHNDTDNYNKQLLGKSYCYCLKKDPSVIVCAFTLSNASVEARNLPNNRKKKLTEDIPYEKRLSSYPATLIGRLGVSEAYRQKGIGTEVMELIKLWMLESSNKTACRYLTVDAYNKEATIKFYEANGFKLLFSAEEQERKHIGLSGEEALHTRLMYFDLIRVGWNIRNEL